MWYRCLGTDLVGHLCRIVSSYYTRSTFISLALTFKDVGIFSELT